MTTVEAPSLPIDLDPRVLGIQVEAKLRDWNIPYDYKAEYPIAEVRSVEWTQVREEAHLTDPETLAEFRTQMQQGAVYPPIVLMHPDVLVDGNHRLNAARSLRRKTIPAFVVQFQSVDLAQTFNAALNMLNGRRLSTEEAFNAALTMMARGMADEAVAREIGRSVERVRQIRREKEFSERSAALPEIALLAEKITRPNRTKLAQISHDPAFAEAVKVVAGTKVSAKDVGEIVKAATSARTDTDAIEAVRAKKAELAPAGPPPYRVVVPQAVRQAKMHLAGLLKLGQKPPDLLDTVTPERRTEAIGQWQLIRTLADEVLALYGEQ